MGSCLSSESKRTLPDSSPTSFLGIRRSRSSKKRSGSQTSSFNYRREERLHRIPSRMFLNGASGIASLFTQQGKKGTNQDAMLVWENFGSRTDTVFCGVFDGHGPYGHKVAKKVRDSLPLKLNAYWEGNLHSEDILKEISLNKLGSMNSDDTSLMSVAEESRASVDLEGIEKHPEVFQTLKKSFLKAFRVMDRELGMSSNIDCFCSGTTAVTLIKQGEDLVIGNVGDSRAILGTRDKDDSLLAVQLTVDLKPNLPGEEERIQRCRGRVFALEDEPDVSRVWLPDDDSPGLAMARAFGDFCLKDFGLISVPDVYYRRLSEKDQFIVLATDGIWDVLSNEEVVDIVASAPERSSAARALVESAVRVWRCKYPTSKTDDCAAVCLFLDSSPNSTSLCSNSMPKEQQQPSSGDQLEDPSAPAGLPRSGTVRKEEEEEEEEQPVASKDDEQLLNESVRDWSATEGVSRVDTLLNLPRFLAVKDDEKTADPEMIQRC